VLYEGASCIGKAACHAQTMARYFYVAQKARVRCTAEVLGDTGRGPGYGRVRLCRFHDIAWCDCCHQATRCATGSDVYEYSYDVYQCCVIIFAEESLLLEPLPVCIRMVL
jgi:hypothetical protein